MSWPAETAGQCPDPCAGASITDPPRAAVPPSMRSAAETAPPGRQCRRPSAPPLKPPRPTKIGRPVRRWCAGILSAVTVYGIKCIQHAPPTIDWSWRGCVCRERFRLTGTNITPHAAAGLCLCGAEGRSGQHSFVPFGQTKTFRAAKRFTHAERDLHRGLPLLHGPGPASLLCSQGGANSSDC